MGGSKSDLVTSAVILVCLTLPYFVSGLWEPIGTCGKKAYLAEVSKTVRQSVAAQMCTNNSYALVSVADEAEFKCLSEKLRSGTFYWTSAMVDLMWESNVTSVEVPYETPSIPWHPVCMYIGKNVFRLYECYADIYFYPLCQIILA